VTGRLVVCDDSGDESLVFIRDGIPVHVERPNQLDRLDRILLAAGVVTEEAVSAADAEVAVTGRRLGDVLISRGAITPRGLSDVLKAQLRRKLTRLFFPTRGTYALHIEEHEYGVGDEFGAMRVDPRSLLYAGIRAAYDEQRLRSEIHGLQGRTLRLVGTVTEAYLDGMGLPKGDATVALLQRRAVVLADLPPPGVKPVEALATVLALHYGDLLEVTDPVLATSGIPQATARPGHRFTPSGPMPVAGVPAPAPEADPAPTPTPATSPASVPASLSPPAAPRPIVSPERSSVRPAALATHAPSPEISPAAAELRARIDDLGAKLDTLSHFEVLGIPEDASVVAVSNAYLKSVRLFHPDRLASLGLKALVPRAERITARLGEAQGVLSDPKKRAEYVATRGRALPESGAAILAAELCFQKGESALRKGDFKAALDAFDEAARGNPLEPAYKTYWAWSRYEGAGAGRTTIARETATVLLDAVKERPRFPMAFHWLGLVYKQLGDLNAAEAAFREALTQSPQLLDAERELRLIEMRKAQPAAGRPTSETSKPPASSLFDRLLKR
jgi:tetratricopeptide (TPR) repeat protein